MTGRSTERPLLSLDEIERELLQPVDGGLESPRARACFHSSRDSHSTGRRCGEVGGWLKLVLPGDPPYAENR